MVCKKKTCYDTGVKTKNAFALQALSDITPEIDIDLQDSVESLSLQFVNEISSNFLNRKE